MHAYNNRIPPIATEDGTKYRSDVIGKHLESEFHKECVKKHKADSMAIPQISEPIKFTLGKMDKNATKHIGKLMIQVFMDAKHLSLPAYNFPPRYVTSESSHNFTFGMEQIVPKNLSLQYVTPVQHLAILKTIVSADTNTIKKKINNCLALSVRVDGSIDRWQIDKINVTDIGNVELLFLGVGDQTEKGADGLLKATLGAINSNFSEQFTNETILKKASSIVTDGANINSGEKGGLWKLFTDKISASGSQIPIIKIWCSAHRADLVFADATKKFPELTKMFGVLNSIATHFHRSAVRKNELKKISNENALKIRSIPKLFKVRWVEYTFNSLQSILVSWNALVLFFENDTEDVSSAGFYRYLTNLNNLKVISFIGDVKYIYKRFQKKLQSDSLTLPKMIDEVNDLIVNLDKLRENPLLGGFESTFEKTLKTEKKL